MTAIQAPATVTSLDAARARRRKARRRRGQPEVQDPRGKRLFLYVRISDIDGREDTEVSSELQESNGRRWAEHQGATIVEVVKDLGFTGREFDKRQIGNLIDRVEQGEADGILVYKVDRWGRNLNDSLRNILDLQGVGGLIFSTSENLNEIDSPMGRFQLSQLLLMAQYQSDEIGKRWRDLHTYRLDKGVPAGGGKRFGYVYTPSAGRDMLGHYQPDEDGGTADAVREVYRRYIANETVPSIVDWLRAKGFKTTRGNDFSQSSVYNLMDSGFSAGLLVINDTEVAWGVLRTYLPGKHEPLLDPDTWQLFKDKRTSPVPARTKSAPYRTAGLVWCAGCKKRCYKNDAIQVRKDPKDNWAKAYLRCHLSPKQKAYMACPNPARMSMEHIDDAVLHWLQQRGGHEELAEVELLKRQRVGVLQDDRAKLERGLGRAQSRLVKLTERSLLDEDEPGYLDPMTFKLNREKTVAEIGRLEKEIEELSREERVNTTPSTMEFQALAAAWDVLDARIINEALQKLIQVIYLHRSETGTRLQIVARWEEDPYVRTDARLKAQVVR